MATTLYKIDSQELVVDRDMAGGQARDSKHLNSLAQALANRLYAESLKAGYRGFVYCVLRADNSEMRPFNVDPKYPGQLNSAEVLLTSPLWRLATPEEVVAGLAKQDEHRRESAARRLSKNPAKALA
jgi:hypothetical protein